MPHRIQQRRPDILTIMVGSSVGVGKARRPVGLGGGSSTPQLPCVTRPADSYASHESNARSYGAGSQVSVEPIWIEISRDYARGKERTQFGCKQQGSVGGVMVIDGFQAEGIAREETRALLLIPNGKRK